MIRIIILIVAGYLLYRAVKSWMLPTSSKRSVSRKNTTEIDDVMIKDPFCESYFPKRNGVHLNFNGKDLYFCSSKCRDEFAASHSTEKET